MLLCIHFTAKQICMMSKQASLFAQLINKDIISMNNVQGQAARKAHKAQHCWPPCKKNDDDDKEEDVPVMMLNCFKSRLEL